MSDQLLTIGNPVLRYSAERNADEPQVDGLPNYFYLTRPPVKGAPLAILESGINPIAKIAAIDGPRRPAILIASSPHRVGSEGTPWEDSFDADRGRILYYGDCKGQSCGPAQTRGNRTLLEEFPIHRASSEADRALATPLIFFRRVPHAGRKKGHVVFEGYGLIEQVELVVQYAAGRKATFSNYVFHCAVLSLAHEKEEFDWSWINSRRDPSVPLAETVKQAPAAWRGWLQQGSSSVERYRRNVSKLKVLRRLEQLPPPDTREESALRQIYEFYSGRKHRFEALSAEVTGRILGRTGAYSDGWITSASSDGGVDFVGRLDLGSAGSRVSIVVLGQAKCESLVTPTGGGHVARTVARLKRGWIGAYVTTSFFSEAVQREIIEDQYPILLVAGGQLAREALEMASERGMTLDGLLIALDQTYPSRIRHRRPEDVLLFGGGAEIR